MEYCAPNGWLLLSFLFLVFGMGCATAATFMFAGKHMGASKDD